MNARRLFPAPSLPREKYREYIPEHEMNPAVLNSPVGTVYVAVLNGYTWICQRYSADGDMYCWLGSAPRDIDSIYNGNCVDKEINDALWQPLVILAAPESDLRPDAGDPYSDFSEFRKSAVSEWVAGGCELLAPWEYEEAIYEY